MRREIFLVSGGAGVLGKKGERQHDVLIML
jgi:hypothetical protein